MNPVAIDLDTLDDLFAKQKKMDELFDSLFNNDNYFIASSSSSSEVENRTFTFEEEDRTSDGEGDSIGSRLKRKIHIPYRLILAVSLEIGAIYWVAANFL